MQFLVAIDGSPASDRAIDCAAEIAAAADASLTVVHSVDPDVYDTGGTDPVTDRPDLDQRLIIESVADAEDRGQRLVDEAVEQARDRDPDAEGELLYGAPVETLSEFAADEGFDAVFVGHRGLSEAHERVLGSVAKGLVEPSSVPVTVVR
jgi:nucleotide-binding universal stress UspA family protein